MSVRRTRKLSSYGWKTYEIEGRESVRLLYGEIELSISTNFEDREGNDVCSVQIVHPARVKLEEKINSPQRREILLRIPPPKVH